MAAETYESLPAEGGPEGPQSRSWRDRIDALASAARAALSTRLAILREEAAEKAVFAAKGLVGIAAAAIAGAGALLLFAALIAAIFAALLKSLILGLLAAFVLYAVLAGVAAWLGIRALRRMKPFDFEHTRRELESDWEAVRPPGPEEEIAVGAVAGRPADASYEDAGLEERFRAGAE